MGNREATPVIHKHHIYPYVKLSIDFVLALIGLLLLSPLFLIIGITIKIDDPKAPIFFKQQRVGLNGKYFFMYKFRSMHVNAEEKLDTLLKYNEVQGAMFKMKNDPRITKIGNFLRKTSIDELPQLWNVVKGDMALVGPRPPLPREVALYTERDKRRLSVIPGCTGLWQVSGRSELSFEEMVNLDLYYISHLTYLLDLKIIFKTFAVIIHTKDAY